MQRASGRTGRVSLWLGIHTRVGAKTPLMTEKAKSKGKRGKKRIEGGRERKKRGREKVQGQREEKEMREGGKVEKEGQREG